MSSPISFEDFYAYYEKWGKCLNQLAKPKKPLNDAQILSKYNAYVRSLETKQNNIKKKLERSKVKEPKALKGTKADEKWVNTCEIVDRRDKRECRLIKTLKASGRLHDLDLLYKNAGNFLKRIDHAHILPKSRYAYLYYNVENIILLNRYSHSLLDQYCDPITGKKITTEEHKLWWEFLVSSELLEKLEEIVQERNQKIS